MEGNMMTCGTTNLARCEFNDLVQIGRALLTAAEHTKTVQVALLDAFLDKVKTFDTLMAEGT